MRQRMPRLECNPVGIRILQPNRLNDRIDRIRPMDADKPEQRI